MGGDPAVGSFIKTRRQALALTQEDLAELVKCAPETIRSIESGRRQPSPKLAKQLAEQLKIPLDEQETFILWTRGTPPADWKQLLPPASSLVDAQELPEAERTELVSIDRAEPSVDRLAPPTQGVIQVASVSHAALPSGTVTFLFTDIEGSTRLWEQHPETMRAALERHDEILREAIQAHGGVIFKTVGDGVHAAFARATDALAAALTIHRTLDTEEWKTPSPLCVRMALHTGVAEERDGDYFGPPLNRVARLRDAGYGGQILVTRATQELVCDTLPADVTLRYLGRYRLKDLIRPEHIFQVNTPVLPTDFPSLRTLDILPHNLPVQPTPLIGREREITEMVTQLRRADVRLITLTGPGGTGKTHLALQAAAQMFDVFADGVWFVDLAPISNPELVVATIAHTLGVRETGTQALIEQLCTYLYPKRLLLLLDNFEQVVDAAPRVSELLAAAPQVKILVTSRTVLRVRGEKEYIVLPLALPDLKQLPPLATLSQYAALELFIQRVQDVKPDFQLTSANARAVAEICARMDGLPLALGLTAARIKLFSPEALLERLERRLGVLTSGPRDVPARQQTIRNTIEWSYHLLGDDQKLLFARLGVFVGGCTLEATEAICNTDSDLPMDVVGGIAALVDQSLLRQEESTDGESRFLMLETVREYTWECLKLSGEMSIIRNEHADYYLKLTEEAESTLGGQGEKMWLDRLEREYDNLRTALEWLMEQESPQAGLRLAGALWQYWTSRGNLGEGRKWLGRLLTQARHSNTPAAVLAKALHAAGALARYQGDYVQATRLYEESLALRRELGDKRDVAWSLLHIGNIARDQGKRDQSMTLYEESLALFREAEDKSGIAVLLHHLASDVYMSQDYEKASRFLSEALMLSREQEDTPTTGAILRDLAELVHTQGDSIQAMALLEESVELFRSVRHKLGIAYSLKDLANIACDSAKYDHAIGLYKESLALFQEEGIKVGIVSGLLGLARIAKEQAQTRRAARLFGFTEAFCEGRIEVWPPRVRADLDKELGAPSTKFGESAGVGAWAEGRAMTLNQAIAYALDDGNLSATYNDSSLALCAEHSVA